MELRKGSRVLCPAGRGTVIDMTAGQSLVKLDTGTVLDTTHGQWWEDVRLAVIGFDPDVMVSYANRMVPASDTL